MGEFVKVHFQLQQDEDGYPPVAVESLWAQPGTNEGEYIINNVPFFARDATIGDTVLVREDDGNLWFDRIIRRSENSLLRVVFFELGAVTDVSRRLTSLGCEVEYLQSHGLLAVSVPPSALLSEVQSYLQNESSAGTIDYEEAILRQ